MMKSTKEPTKIKPNRKRQADEEFKLIKGLTESIVERRKRKLIENQSASPDDAFGRYIIQTLAELDSNVKHLAQYRINDILFQAQTGELARSHSNTGTYQSTCFSTSASTIQYAIHKQSDKK